MHPVFSSYQANSTRLEVLFALIKVSFLSSLCIHDNDEVHGSNEKLVLVSKHLGRKMAAEAELNRPAGKKFTMRLGDIYDATSDQFIVSLL